MSRQPDSAMESSRLWSCDTLKDGITHLMSEVDAVGEEENLLEIMIKDSVIKIVECQNAHP